MNFIRGLVRMSNLGGYQIITTVIKKVGGPKKAVALLTSVVASIAAATGIGGYALGKKKISHKLLTDKQKDNKKTYTVIKYGESNEGIALNKGDKFVVIMQDKDAVLIEIIGAKDNPYFVSASLLQNISDFQM